MKTSAKAATIPALQDESDPDRGQLGACVEAAEDGKADALYKLGLLYSTGRRECRDYVAAHKWLNLAALKGELRAAKDRSELAKDMSRGEVREALRQAREWVKTH